MIGYARKLDGLYYLEARSQTNIGKGQITLFSLALFIHEGESLDSPLPNWTSVIYGYYNYVSFFISRSKC